MHLSLIGDSKNYVLPRAQFYPPTLKNINTEMFSELNAVLCCYILHIYCNILLNISNINFYLLLKVLTFPQASEKQELPKDVCNLKLAQSYIT